MNVAAFSRGRAARGEFYPCRLTAAIRSGLVTSMRFAATGDGSRVGKDAKTRPAKSIRSHTAIHLHDARFNRGLRGER